MAIALRPQFGAMLMVLLSSMASSQQPVQVPFSGKAAGFDGPWNTVNISVGTPPQYVELTPSSYFGTVVLSNQFCDNKNFTQSGFDCYQRPYGFYNADKSDSSYPFGTGFRDPDWTIPIPMDGKASHVYDNIEFNDAVCNVTILYTDWAYTTYLGKRRIPVALGQMSLGSFHSVDPNELGLPDSPNTLYYEGKLPSATFGIHVGSAAPLIPGGIPGSLWFGGYDQNRVIGPVVSTTAYMSSYPYFQLIWRSLDFTTLSTGENLRNQTNLIPELSTQFTVGVQSTQPYMILPQSFCDAMTKDLPIKYNETIGFYLWDVDDPAYTRFLLNGPNYFTFQFDNNFTTAEQLTIRVPMTLLHLNLTSPLVESPTPYFPCLRHESLQVATQTYVLGQAFLQATFMAVNWWPISPQATMFYLAQAPGPSLDTSPNIRTMSDDTNVDPFSGLSSDSYKLWARSWYPFFNEHGGASLKIPPLGSSDGNDSSDLSGGTIAGIVLGVVFGVGFLAGLAAYIFIQQRRQRRDLEMVAAEHRASEKHELDGNHVYEAGGREWNPELEGSDNTTELPYQNEKFQLPGDEGEYVLSPITPIHRLGDGGGLQAVELSARGSNIAETGSSHSLPRAFDEHNSDDMVSSETEDVSIDSSSPRL